MDDDFFRLSPAELRDSIERNEARIREYTQQNIRYRGRLNAIEPLINVLLPPELLGHIFKQYMLMCTSYFDAFRVEDVWKRREPYEWVHVALVCRYWRSIALSTPELFARIDFSRSNETHISCWVSRAKDVPLHVLGNTEDYDSIFQGGRLRHWEAILPYAERFKSLKIYYLVHADLYSSVGWPESFVNLDDLSLLSWDDSKPEIGPEEDLDYGLYDGLINPSEDDWWADSEDYIKMARRLLDRSPNLRVLSIGLLYRRNTIHLSHLSHQSLTRLVLSDWKTSSIDGDECHSTILTSVLRQLPMLDIMELLKIGSIPSPPLLLNHNLTRATPQRHLSQLTVTGELSSVMQLLTSGVVGSRKLNILASWSGTISDEDSDVISAAVLSLPFIPWNSLVSLKTRTQATHELGRRIDSWTGWSYRIPSRLHDADNHTPLSTFSLSITANSFTWADVQINKDFGARLTAALAEGLPAIESLSTKPTLEGRYQTCSPDFNESMTHLYTTLSEVQDFSVFIDDTDALRTLLRAVGEHSVLPALSSLNITLSTSLDPETVLEDIRVCCQNRHAYTQSPCEKLVVTMVHRNKEHQYSWD